MRKELPLPMQSPELEPDSRATGSLTRRMVAMNTATSALGVLLVSSYLALVLRLPAEQWTGFLQTVGLWYALLLPLSLAHQRSFYRPVLQHLWENAQGKASPGSLRAAYVAALDLPRRTSLASVGWWTLGGAVVAATMKLRFPELDPWSGFVLFVSAASGGLVTSVFLGYWVKRTLSRLREALAVALADVDERGTWVRKLPLLGKLWIATTAATLVPVSFAILFAQSQVSRSVEAAVGHLEARLLEEAIGSARLESRALATQLEALELDARIVVLDRLTDEVVEGDAEALTVAERRWILADAEQQGDGLGIDSPHVFSWRAHPDGRRIVVLSAPWSAAASSAGSAPWVFALLLGASASAALGVAYLAARDIGEATRLLRREVERVASGDLRAGSPVESEDELGDLGRSFARMARALREMVGRVMEAADRVEGTARETEGIGEGVSAVTVDQVRGIQQATVSMDGIHGQVKGIADSAERLSTSVEESSSSVLELGASGEELSQTASVLSEQVATVSSSIEQMGASARQVAGSTESLAEAAEETSSSMEEMATSMREVDSAAAETGRLSSQVADMAEVGCRQVRETIAGMEAIREATETAERVIRGLGARAQEIGAILDVIEDVADETNLLALNASIIAAQAGEHGRAFSVVAEEIKDLADRVLVSTQEIAGVVRAVQAESQAAVGAVERGSASVVAGVERSAEAGVSLEEITRVAHESGDRMEAIVEAVRQQTRAAGHVAELMERVRAGAESIRSATREQGRGAEVVERGSGRMTDVAQQVHRTTEEQTRGTGRLQTGMESIRDAVEQIHRALQEQSSACRQAAQLMEHVYARTRANKQVAQRMGQTTRALRTHAESLREDVRRFRL